jgi:lysophospholipid hydrolase
VGEVGLFVDAPRSATVVALRDSDLVELPKALIERHPPLLAKVARAIALRVHDRGASAAPPRRAETIALLPVGSAPIDAVASRLAQALHLYGPTIHLDARRFDHAFGKDGAAQLPRDHPLSITLTGWSSEREREHDHVVYVAEAHWSEWTQRCLRQADRIVLVATAGEDPRPGGLEEALAQARLGAPVDLVLVHRESTELPEGTLAWLTARSVDRHYHVRLGDDGDFGRLARGLTGRSMGVVCSGGGARGFVHVGLLRACEDLGLDVDAVGGTSMGAMVGGAYALSRRSGFCYEQSSAFARTRYLDYTLPIAALTSSKRVTAVLRAMFGEARIEDLWVPYFCVSTNLTRGERMVHRRGLLWQAVRASMAIPGVFTPVLHEGDVLVDGGITSNYPVDVMREWIATGAVIASNAYPDEERAKPYDFAETISGWRVLWGSVNPLTRSLVVPSILETLIGATSINSRYLTRAMAELADVSISYPVEDFSPLRFDRYVSLVDIGYDRARPALEGWLERSAGSA